MVLLVVAEQISGTARTLLEAGGVAFVDRLGHASIRMPGIFIRTGGFSIDSHLVRQSPHRAQLSGKSGLVAETLLLDPQRPWKVDDLATKSTVSAGLTHRVLVRLEDLGIVEKRGSGPSAVRHLPDPGALLDLWAEEEHDVRPKETAVYVLARPGSVPAQSLSARLNEHEIVHAISGAAAAAMVAPSVTSTPVVRIRLTSAVSVDLAIAAAGGRQVEDGQNVVLVQASDDLALRSRQLVKGAWLTAFPRTYIDLLRDPRRGREQAAAFRQQALAF